MVGPDSAVYLHAFDSYKRVNIYYFRYDEKFKQESAQKLAEVRD